MTPRFFYFDLGNVLVRFCNDRMFRQMAAASGIDEDAIRQAAMATGTPDDVQWRFECGLLSPEEYYAWFCEVTGSTPDRAALELAFCDIFEPIPESMELVTALAAAGRRLGILSNTNAMHWPFLTDGRFPQLNDAFELHVTSFGARAMKPDPAIYNHAARRAGCEPGELFFTDDRPENVAGAIACGVDAVVFTSTEQLADELRRRGVRW